ASAAGLLFVKPQQVRGSQANSTVRLGLLGCGGRGTGVASSFITNAGAKVTALGDIFQAQVERTAARLTKQGASISQSQMFTGPDAYKKLFASDAIDAVVIATPVYFHPEHFEAAVEAGKHVYLEKPVGADMAGVQRVRVAGQKAKGKISVTVGLQLRHATPYVELVKRIRGGAIGDVVSALVHYYAGALNRPPTPGASPLERRMRNWVWDRVLSGDIVVEQNVHVLDMTNWVLGAHPIKVVGSSGRKGRTDDGDASSHYDCVYTYPNDIHVSFASTQFIKGSWSVAMRYFGTRGNAEARYDAPVMIEGEENWEFPGLGKPGQVTDSDKAAVGAFSGALDDADKNKHAAFIASITSGNFLNELEPGVSGTISAIMAREAADTGRVVSWNEVSRSNDALDAYVDLNDLV
ncbi:MAG: Gfo/Idh/MocA family oxidoreductase, partial [bacterium]|nr:Gfo/Idh/MocA family oxidoreductase [bacterium]